MQCLEVVAVDVDLEEVELGQPLASGEFVDGEFPDRGERLGLPRVEDG